MMTDEHKALITDLTGLAKVADSELAKELYGDLAKQPAVHASKILTSSLQTVEVMLKPLRTLLVGASERLNSWLENVLESVPEPRRQDPAPSIAGPVIRSLIFTEEKSPLKDLYLNLLKCAIDKERAGEAHAAFSRLIDQLAPDEALLLYFISKTNRRCVMTWSEAPLTSEQLHIEICKADMQQLQYPQNAKAYFQHLVSLSLLTWAFKLGGSKGISETQLSAFGHQFAAACIPSKWLADAAVSDDAVLATD
jgi:hypothetical protein